MNLMDAHQGVVGKAERIAESLKLALFFRIDGAPAAAAA